MKPGASNVYQRTAGTGAAWIGPGSSFDPVQFARFAGQMKMAGEQQKQQQKQKQFDDFLKKSKLTPMAVLDEHRDYLNRVEDDFYGYMINTIGQRGVSGIQPQDWVMADKYSNDVAQDQQRLKVWKQNVDAFDKTLLGDKSLASNQIYNHELSQKNKALLLKPYMFADDPVYGSFIQETLQPYIELYSQDPVYGKDQEVVLTKASLDWAEQYGGQLGLLDPVPNPESLFKDWKENVAPNLPDLSTYKSVRDANGNTITEENKYTLPEDTWVTAVYEDKDGKEVEEQILIPGTRNLSLQYYKTSQIGRSSDQYFMNDPNRQQYIDQYGEDAAANYYADQVMNLGLQATSKTLKQAPLKTKGGYGYGGQTYDFEVRLDSGTQAYNRFGVFGDDKGKNKGIAYAYAQVPVRGISFGSDRNKYPKLKIRPTRIFNRDNYAWEEFQSTQDFDFTATGVYEAPTVSGDIDLTKYPEAMKWAADNYGSSSNSAMAKLFKDRIKNGNLIISKGTVLSTEEAKLLKRLGVDVVSEKFVTGQVNGYDIVNNKSFEIPAASVPLYEIDEQLRGATNGTDWSYEINAAYNEDPNNPNLNWWDDSPVIKKDNKVKQNPMGVENFVAPDTNTSPFDPNDQK